eukprot:1088256-Alexandrium_andersonii.AAC.1
MPGRPLLRWHHNHLLALNNLHEVASFAHQGYVELLPGRPSIINRHRTRHEGTQAKPARARAGRRRPKQRQARAQVPNILQRRLPAPS